MIPPMTNLVRFRKVGGRNVATNDHGAYAFLDDQELATLAGGLMAPGHPRFEELRIKGFVLLEDDLDRIAADYARKTSFLLRGPTLHIMVVTLRCNEVCAYCHASRAGMDRTETDMTASTADQVLDMILLSPSDTLTIEFQGGEPLANWPVVKHVIESATERNRAIGKRIMFSLVTNLALMDEEKLAFLADRRVQVCTSLDGPADLHDHNRRLTGGSSHEATVTWMRRINEAYVSMGLDPTLYHVEALVTVTRDHLGRAGDLVDEYVRQGCRAIFLRPLNPFGYARHTAGHIGYNAAEFLAFYRQALDRIIDLNRKGVEFLERHAAIFLTKILTPDDPNYMDIRSPCGAGIGQVAYNHDGGIFTCDEGRMVFQMGDDAFRLGEVKDMTLDAVVTHDTVRSIAMASCLDSIPGCAQCAFKPYCGTCPVYNYGEQGNIFPQNPTNDRCAIYMGIQDRLFELLMSNDKEIDAILNRWVIVKERTEYLHGPA